MAAFTAEVDAPGPRGLFELVGLNGWFALGERYRSAGWRLAQFLGSSGEPEAVAESEGPLAPRAEVRVQVVRDVLRDGVHVSPVPLDR